MLFQMGDSSIEVTDESRESSQLAKAKAMEAISEGNITFNIDDRFVVFLLYFYGYYYWEVDGSTNNVCEKINLLHGMVLS